MTKTPTTEATIDRFANVVCHHATRAKANRLAQMLEAEYPILSLVAQTNPEADDNRVISWAIHHNLEVMMAYDKVPELETVLADCQEQDLDPEELPEGTEEEDTEAGGSVVAQRYREKYSQASDSGQSCGDWLANLLETLTTEPAGGKRRKSNTLALEQLFDENGLDLNEKWATNRSPGWQGRFRMSGRQRLELRALLHGGVFFAGVKHEMPEEAREELATKHAGTLAKLAKKAAREAEKTSENEAEENNGENTSENEAEENNEEEGA